MESIFKRVLEIFDELSRDTLDLSTLVEHALPQTNRSPSADRDALRAAVEQLLRQGFLRPVGVLETYARTEDGRLALAGPRDVTLYSRPGCHLCEEAKAQMVPLLGKFGAKLREVNIDADPLLRERYTNDVPVVFLGSRKVAKHRLNLSQFRRQLEQAHS